MKQIVWFREVRKKDVGLVGGKGASLGEMVSEDFPVPPGFIVTSKAYFDFIEKRGLKETIVKEIDSINVEDSAQLNSVAGKIRELILGTEMDPDLEEEIRAYYSKLGEKQLAWLTSREEEAVAVRSSATAEDLPEASFAGQQETYLNVKGRKQLSGAIKKCWASLFTSRAVYYRKKQNFATEKVGMAVVVQRMVNSDFSGVMFTASPEGDKKKIVIEGGYGLGESIVSGSITPDTYYVDKGSMKILEKKVHKQQWMTSPTPNGCEKVEVQKAKQEKQKILDSQILELAKIGKQIELHYRNPQDIEWGIEKNNVYILQSRPITTLKLGKEKETEEIKEEKKAWEGKESLITGLGASPGIVSGKAKVIPSVEEIGKVEKGDILVTAMTTPDWVPAMRKSRAIITDEGGVTCHAAIVSRELGIPCVVGTGNATKTLCSGETLTVDGFTGKVFRGKKEVERPEKKESEIEIIEKYEVEPLVERLKKEGEEVSRGEGEKEKILALLEKRSVKVKVNVALPEAAENAAKTGAEGVGLLRAEHMITSSGIHPAEFIRQGKSEELVDTIKKGIRNVAEKFKGTPVWYRTFDARTDEFTKLKGGEKEPKEDNPMLGWHGIRRSLDEPEILKAEFKAIKELAEEGLKNVGVMIPFAQHPDELRKAKEIAESVGLKPRADVEFGIMVETPASALAIGEFIKEGIDFISFGTNDLTQLTLGLDRNNFRIQKWFTALHPAVLKQCEKVIKECKPAGVKTSICGQAASNPEMVGKLVEYGIDSVSANIDSVEKIKRFALLEAKRQALKKFYSEE